MCFIYKSVGICGCLCVGVLVFCVVFLYCYGFVHGRLCLLLSDMIRRKQEGLIMVQHAIFQLLPKLGTLSLNLLYNSFDIESQLFHRSMKIILKDS